MIRRLGVFRGESVDPHWNLAVEEYLLQNVGEEQCILYLWQNQHTVVIGRNQNAWKECRTTLLEEEGGHLARRLSGGGAVFHDLGNLNFTFLLPDDCYDLDRQLRVIETACRNLGIHAERSGRNDILADGRKFSGNAFYHHRGRAYHHGTLLVDVDMEKLSRYLNPSREKLAAKGVESVRSRVVNLKELKPELTIEKLCDALVCAFSQVWDLPVEQVKLNDKDREAVEKICCRNRSWDWNYGRQIPFTFSCQQRFSWGEVSLQLQVEGGIVREVQVWSDAMDWRLTPALEQALTGCRFTEAELCQAVERMGFEDAANDVCQMLKEQEI